MLFVILYHWSALRRINKAALFQCILKCANVLRCSARSTNCGVRERGLSLTTVEELRGNVSDLPQSPRCQQQSKSQDIEFRCNVAYAGVGTRKLRIRDKSTGPGLQTHPECLELQENMAYQRPSECSDFPEYEIIS